MSKVAVQGNASGTGTLTLEAPNTNTDRTLTLPDESGALLTSISSINRNQIVGGAGKVLQVVQGTYALTFSTTSSGYMATGLQATITPTSSSSKILIISREQINGDIDNDGLGDATGQYALYRNGSSIFASGITAFARGGLQRINDGGFKYLDSPNSTSALTYATYLRMAAGSRSVVANNDGLSTIILMEIAA